MYFSGQYRFVSSNGGSIFFLVFCMLFVFFTQKGGNKKKNRRGKEKSSWCWLKWTWSPIIIWFSYSKKIDFFQQMLLLISICEISIIIGDKATMDNKKKVQAGNMSRAIEQFNLMDQFSRRFACGYGLMDGWKIEPSFNMRTFLLSNEAAITLSNWNIEVHQVD